MALQFTTLASGSRGNVAWLRAGGAGLLIDLGLGPRDLQSRLAAIGTSWSGIAAALLTHTHRDHVGPAILRWLARERITLCCHHDHATDLDAFEGFRLLQRRGLVRFYDDRPFLAPNGMRVEAIPVSHDSNAAFGFRVEARVPRSRSSMVAGYVADTGCWNDAILDALTGVDLLALEFNHDEAMQRDSGRPWHLIQRNLGDRGHLSNRQAAALLAEILRRSGPVAPRCLVPLHLSEQCNRLEHVLDALRVVLRGWRRRLEVHPARQDAPLPMIRLSPRRGAALAASGPARFPWEAA